MRIVIYYEAASELSVTSPGFISWIIGCILIGSKKSLTRDMIRDGVSGVLSALLVTQSHMNKIVSNICTRISLEVNYPRTNRTGKSGTQKSRGEHAVPCVIVVARTERY